MLILKEGGTMDRIKGYFFKLRKRMVAKIKNKNVDWEIYPVFLNKNTYTNRFGFSLKFQFIFWVAMNAVLAFAGAILNSELILIPMLIFNFYFLGRVIFRFSKRLSLLFFGERYRPFERELRNLILRNNYYEKNEYGYTNYLSLFYTETQDMLYVFAQKEGDRYQELTSKLRERLEAVLNLEFYRMEENAKSVEYQFRKFPVARKMIDKIEHMKDPSMNIEIFDDLGLSLNNNYSGIISGASGGGKSYLVFHMMTQFCMQVMRRQVGRGKKISHAKLYIVDPKESDLFKHCQVAEFPENQYGSTVGDAFRIMREVTVEMERRKKIYSENKEVFDSTILGMGEGEPILVLIDEYPSLVALMDKKQREDFDKLVGNFARLSRQLSLGIWVIAQQANAESIPTAIRDNLVGFRAFMGNPSPQSAMMMFERSTKELPEVIQVGEGIISIDGREPRKFLAPTFIGDVNKIIQPVLKTAVENWREVDEFKQQEEMKMKQYEAETIV